MYQVRDFHQTYSPEGVSFVGSTVIEALTFFAAQNGLGRCRWYIRRCHTSPSTGLVWNTALGVPFDGGESVTVCIEDYFPLISEPVLDW